ncbi:flagellin [Planomonospora sp. ID82291]|uniref:flagellin N-terminal helical domain-containing protein n=1 Tax=Planomonospora sp. ID82291 TaxID=2738136 RepID=UPI0018C434A8|nr:flagellin [Planomonospora sp. ID82291]MBG0818570.1 flagellin [Planomonospora sp. ID82291]
MGLRINQNIGAMNAYRNLSINDGAMSKSLEKLSSGYRINRAADDAAGLSISEGLRAQTGGLKVAVRNAQDGVSVVQTAEGALTETHSILQRMRDLSVQASNGGSQDAKAQEAANKEFSELKTELDRIAKTTSFGTQNLLDGSYGARFQSTATAPATFATKTVAGDATDQFAVTTKVNGTTQNLTVTMSGTAGTSYDNVDSYVAAMNSGIRKALTDVGGTGEELRLTYKTDDAGDVSYQLVGQDAFNVTAAGANVTGVGVQNVALKTGSGGTFQVGANNNDDERINVQIDSMDSNSIGLGGVNLSSTDAAQAAITALDGAIQEVSDQRAKLGAFQNRFEHTINNLNVAIENLSASESRIRDTDMAQEMVGFTRNQILSQAGTSMLAQANQAPQSVLKLLG